MRIVKVTDNETRKKFLQIGKDIYVNDANWVCPLDNDIEQVFNPQKNQYFNGGEAIRWILFDDTGALIGRVAAFYTKDMMESEDKIGGMGFFECIESEAAGELLMDTAKNWLKEKGFKGMDGPINFGERDKYWGLMVEGFENPSYQENYNPKYYKTFFENYGFEKQIEQSTSELVKGEFNFERFNKLGSRVLKNTKYEFKHFTKKEYKKFAVDFAHIYNLAWQNHEGFSPLTVKRVEQLMEDFLPIVVEDIIWFAYAEGEPAGFYVNLIDVNQIFKRLNGKFGWWQKLKFFYYLKTKPVDRVRGIVYGVIPKYHNTGLDTGMIMNFYHAINAHTNVKYVEMAWIGDFNPKMHSLLHSVGAKKTKVHYTYRKEF
jgi:hypothetical protein